MITLAWPIVIESRIMKLYCYLTSYLDDNFEKKNILENSGVENGCFAANKGHFLFMFPQ